MKVMIHTSASLIPLIALCLPLNFRRDPGSDKELSQWLGLKRGWVTAGGMGPGSGRLLPIKVPSAGLEIPPG